MRYCSCYLNIKFQIFFATVENYLHMTREALRALKKILYWKKSSIRTVRDSVNSSWAVISRLARRDASWTKERWKRKNDDQMIKSFLIELGQARSWRVNHATLSPVLQPSKWFPSAHAPPPPLSYYRSPSHGLVHQELIRYMKTLLSSDWFR